MDAAIAAPRRPSRTNGNGYGNGNGNGHNGSSDPYGDDAAGDGSDGDGQESALYADVLDELAGLEPRYPAWLYRQSRVTDPFTGEVTLKKVLNPPKKPKKEQFEEWATTDEKLYTQLVERDRRMIRLYRLTHAGLLEGTEDDDEEITDRIVSPEPKAQVNQLCAMISGLDVKMTWPGATKLEQEVAQNVRAGALWILQEIDRHHRERGSSSFLWDLTYSAAIYGRICIYRGCDPDDPDFPLMVQLADPSTVFPIWGEKGGLLRVTQVTDCTLGRVLDRFDPNGSKQLSKKLRKAKSDDEDATDITVTGTLIDVSTRWHRYVSWEGIQVLLHEHKYGSPPWRIEVMPGEMTQAAMPLTQTGLTRREIERGEDGRAASSSEWDLAEKWQSFLGPAEATIRLDEAIMGLLLTQLELDTNPPQITETPYKETPTRVDLRPGAHTKRRVGEKTNPVQFPIRNNIVGALVARISEMSEKTMLPKNVFGVLEGDSASGFTENTLLAAAKTRIQPYIKLMELTIEDLIADIFYLYHGFAHLYLEDPDGVWTVPATKVDLMTFNAPPAAMQALPYGSPSVEMNPQEVRLTRELFDVVPFRPIVKLHKIDWRELTSIANAVGILMDKGLWGRPRAMAETGVDDHISETHQVIRDLMLSNPKMLELVAGPEELLKSGDIESYLATLQLIVAPAMQQQMASMQQSMQGGGGGAPPQPAPAGEPSVQGIQTVQGDSQPMVGGLAGGGPGAPRTGPEGVPAQGAPPPGGPGSPM